MIYTINVFQKKEIHIFNPLHTINALEIMDAGLEWIPSGNLRTPALN